MQHADRPIGKNGVSLSDIVADHPLEVPDMSMIRVYEEKIQ